MIKILINVIKTLITLIINFKLKEKSLLQDLNRRFLILWLKDFKNVNDYVNEYRRCVRDFVTQSTILFKAFLILKFKIKLSFAFNAFYIIRKQTYKIILKLNVKCNDNKR